MRRQAPCRNEQNGAVAVIVGVTLAVLIGFAGLALDLGRLYINKTELQNAADACALAAASELTCDPSAGTCPVSKLQNGESAGIFAGGKNRRDFQNTVVAIVPADVRFSTTLVPNSAYLPAGSASPNSKFAMCIARSSGIIPWFMGVLGLGDANFINASAVATLGPSQEFCSSAPIGVCAKGAAPYFGYLTGEWIESNFTSGGSDDALLGDFRWIDFTVQAGGNSEIRDQLAGGRVCNLRVGQNVEQHGQQQGAKSAYNTRFGMYPKGANAYTPATAPPDRTGYGYPNKSPGSPVIPINTSAFADYQLRQGLNTPFIDNQYGITGPGGNIPGNPITPTEHAQGSDRRLIAVPVIDCAAGQVTPILGMACVLMLNPMSNGASGTIYLEYREPANTTTAPTACRSSGLPGDSTSTGPMVPMLVQ